MLCYEKNGCGNRRATVLVVIAILALALAWPSTAWGKQEQEAKAKEQSSGQQTETPFYGYRSIPEQTKSIHDANMGGYGEEDLLLPMALPSTYSSVQKGVLTPIKNQSIFGCCWAFSVIAASESSILSKGQSFAGTIPDLSERQLTYFTYNAVNDPLGNLAGDGTIPLTDNYLEQGGNEKLAAYTLASWSGVTDESLAPYADLVNEYDNYEDDDAFLAATALQPELSREHDVAHLTNVRQIPMSDRDDVKRAIMEYGALDASVMYKDEYYNDDTNALYNDKEAGTNHAVALVGWDDGFAKENFSTGDYASPEGTQELPNDYQTLQLGATVTVMGPASADHWFKFTPSQGGIYTFYSYDQGNSDPCGTLYSYDSETGLLYDATYNDDCSDEDRNFSITNRLHSNRTYYLNAESYRGRNASYMIAVTMEADENQQDGEYSLPSQSTQIHEGSAVTVQTEQWLRFEPAQDGVYTIWSYDCQNDPMGTLYVQSATNGQLISLDANDDYGQSRNFSMTRFLYAGNIYFVRCTSYSGSSERYAVAVSGAEDSYEGEGIELPASASVIALDTPVHVEIASSRSTWLQFTPNRDGAYTFSGSFVRSCCINAWRVDSDNGLLGLVNTYSASLDGNYGEDTYSSAVNMKKGGTYFIECEAEIDSTFTVTATYSGEPVYTGPSADGAWLVRNSWGEYSNDNGYFWASYEDVALSCSDSYSSAATAFEYGPANNFDNIYQYDGSCATSWTWIESGGSAANVFEAKANEEGFELLRAVSFWMEDVNVDYSVQVYTGLTKETDPTSGTAALKTPVTGKTSYEGYYTVDLPSRVRLNEGEKYSVVVTVSKQDGSEVCFGFDNSQSWSWVEFVNAVLPGQSFQRDNPNDGWFDTINFSSEGNVRIKAFTTNEQDVPKSVADAEVVVESPVVCTGLPLTPQVTVTYDGAELALDTDYAVSYRDNVEAGTATVTVTGCGDFTGTATSTFQIERARDGWYTFPDGAKGYGRDGRLVRGWLDLGSSKYWFHDTGRMAVGWTDVEANGTTMHYYFNPASGNLVRDTWFKIDGKTYYFRPSGNLATGWATISDNGVDKKYYLDEDGQLLTGWQDIEVNGIVMHYYFRPSGAMATGWATIDGQKYWFRPSGNMATGWADVDDAYKRYFDEQGHMVTGWQTIGGKTYYFRIPSGAMQTGTATIDGKQYLFSDKGVLVS